MKRSHRIAGGRRIYAGGDRSVVANPGSTPAID